MRWIRKHKLLFSAMFTLFFTMFSLYHPSLLHESFFKKYKRSNQTKISASFFSSIEKPILSENFINSHFLVKKLQLDRCEVKHPSLAAKVCLLNNKTAKPNIQITFFSVLDKNCILRI